MHWEGQSGKGTKHSEDITRAGSILATVKSGAKLTNRLQEVYIVAANKILCQVDDGSHQTCLEIERERGTVT